MKFRNITVTDIKHSNYSSIFNLLYQNKKLSRQDIARELDLSLPTVTQNLNKLEEKGLVMENGKLESEVGRRATAYSINSKAYFSVGVEVSVKSIGIVAINMLGKTVSYREYPIAFCNTKQYYIDVSHQINEFLDDFSAKPEQILGIGFAIQGLTSTDGTEVTYGKILNTSDMKIDYFLEYLDYDCLFFHDAKCAATTELWTREYIDDSFYLSISDHLGGAILIDGKIYMGNYGHSGTIEHMTVDPEGPLCYCGKKGCFETYCSMSALLDENETLDSFFTAVRNNEPEYLERWDYFLEIFSNTLNNVRLVLDSNFIMGGHLAAYLTTEDIEDIHKRIFEQSAFPLDEDSRFIEISHSPKLGIPRGAALPFLSDFLQSI